MNSPVLTVRVKGNCSRSQHRRLDQLFSMSAEMYNACLESWMGTYEWWKRHHDPNIEKFPAELSFPLRLDADVHRSPRGPTGVGGGVGECRPWCDLPFRPGHCFFLQAMPGRQDAGLSAVQAGFPMAFS